MSAGLVGETGSVAMAEIAGATPPADRSAVAVLAAMPVGVLLEADRGPCWMNAELRRIWQWPTPDGPARGELQEALERHPRPASSLPRTPMPGLPGHGTSTWRRRLLRRSDGTAARVRVATVQLPVGEGEGYTRATFVMEEGPRAPDAQLRQAFLAMIGHELRTPITSIVAGAELLQGRMLDGAAQDEVAALVVEEANRVHLLVEQLTALTILQSRSSSLAAEPIHLHHLVQAIAARESRRRPRFELRVRLPDRGIGPALGEDGFVAQVVAILVDNAAKYAGTTSPVELALDEADGWVELHVLDRGPGIPGGDPGRLFELYQRDLAVAREAGAAAWPAGSGIGLYVAREIIHAMGGRIWARQRPDGGADVGFALPRAS